MRARGIEIDLVAHPARRQAKTYEMLARGETVGVFQVESQGMRRALLDMRPDRFEDIIALVALYRPGPMANIPTYCARKRGSEQPDYIHPKLEPILRETFGVIIYQEQVMQIAQVLAGYSLGEADLLRRAMGKKIRSEMEAQRERFVSGAVERGVERGQAETIFELLERFADYGFNKSHAAAYALVAYQTAYMKANYPVEFLAASMTLDMGNTDKLAEFRAEAERLGIKVEPPSVNRRASTFEVGRQHHSLRARRAQGRRRAGGRGHRRGARRAAVRRSRRFRRVASIRAPSTSACWKAWPPPARSMRWKPNRARAFAAVDVMLAAAQRAHEAASRRSERTVRRCCAARTSSSMPATSSRGCRPSGCRSEYDAIGFFLSGHPLDDYAPLLKGCGCSPGRSSARAVKAGATAGRVAGDRRLAHRAAHQDRQQDGHHRPVRPDRPLRGGDVRRRPAAVSRPARAGRGACCCSWRRKRRATRCARASRSAEPLDAAAEKVQKGSARFPARRPSRSRPSTSALEPAPGRDGKADGEVNVVLLLADGAEVEMRLPGRFKVSPQIAGAIKAVPGVVAGRGGLSPAKTAICAPLNRVRLPCNLAPYISPAIPHADLGLLAPTMGLCRPVASCTGAHTSAEASTGEDVMALPDYSMRQLLEAGVHFGHQAHRWNPKMGEYIFGTRNNIHIIDLAQTVPMLHRALQAVSDTVAKGGRILFVGTKRQAQEPIADAAKRSAQYYVNSRWLGGTLTNWKTISESISRLRKLDEMLNSGEAPGLHQEGTSDPAARARQARPRARRHQGHGRPARPDVRDRHQQGRHRDQGSAAARNSGRRGRRHQLRSGRHHLSRAGQRRRRPRDQALLRSDCQGRDRRYFARSRRAGHRHRRAGDADRRGSAGCGGDADWASNCSPVRAALPTTSRNSPGVSPAIEKKLNDLGIFHYWQIAGFGPAAAHNVGEEVGLPGRVDGWIAASQGIRRRVMPAVSTAACDGPDLCNYTLKCMLRRPGSDADTGKDCTWRTFLRRWSRISARRPARA